jgi:hypothetical protein
MLSYVHNNCGLNLTDGILGEANMDLIRKMTFAFFCDNFFAFQLHLEADSR